jgi:hypothetical protein
MDELAAKHPRTKFVKIPGRECVPGYPDKNLPTTLVYRDRDVVGSFVGVDGFGGPRFTPEVRDEFVRLRLSSPHTTALARWTSFLKDFLSRPLSARGFLSTTQRALFDRYVRRRRDD